MRHNAYPKPFEKRQVEAGNSGAQDFAPGLESTLLSALRLQMEVSRAEEVDFDRVQIHGKKKQVNKSFAIYFVRFF